MAAWPGDTRPLAERALEARETPRRAPKIGHRPRVHPLLKPGQRVNRGPWRVVEVLRPASAYGRRDVRYRLECVGCGAVTETYEYNLRQDNWGSRHSSCLPSAQFAALAKRRAAGRT